MPDSNTWTAPPDHPGYRCKTIQLGACTIYLMRPELPEDERKKREAHTQAVAERVLSQYYKRKERIT